MEQVKTIMRLCGFVYHFYKTRRAFMKKSGALVKKSRFKR